MSEAKEWLTRFRAAQEALLEIWASVIGYYYNGKKAEATQPMRRRCCM